MLLTVIAVVCVDLLLEVSPPPITMSAKGVPRWSAKKQNSKWQERTDTVYITLKLILNQQFRESNIA